MSRTKTPNFIEGSRYVPGSGHRRADLHLHSNYSYDVLNLPELSPRALYDKAVAAGMGFFCLTDHDTMRGHEALDAELRAEFGDQPPIPLIPGIEIKVRDPRIRHTVHVNVLGLDRRQMGQLARRRRSVNDFLAYCDDHDLYHAYNHPFWFERGELGDLGRITELIARFPVTELNAGRIPQLNGRTRKIAERFGRQVVATSDSHTGRVGKAWTEAPGDSPTEFLRNVRDGRGRAVPHDASFTEFMREVLETIDLVFVKQNAFTPKRTFLKQLPVARAIACAVLENETLMGPRPLKRGVQHGLALLALTPAWAFILQQQAMHWRLGEPIGI
jgi:predicted metal-dependent phosphoesterase TrpH